MEKLAIDGGKPVRDNFLPYGRQKIDDEDIKAVIETLQSDFLTTGPKVSDFEKKINEYVGSKYCVAVSNGTAGLHMACFACGIKEGDEVIVSSMTFVASSNCVLYLGGTPVFADIDKETWNIDTEDIKRKITKKTKAIICVDYTGQPANLDEIKKIAKENNIYVIEDGAHSLGATYKGSKVGALVDFTMFSFHPVKPITTGEGGAICTNNYDMYKKMLMFRSHGITRDKNEFKETNTGMWHYEQQILGYNYRITDIQCALGMSQLNKIDEFINKRRELSKIYEEKLKKIKGITLQKQLDNTQSGRHIFVIRLDLEKFKVGREKIFESLIKENIGVNIHYKPVYLNPYYEQLGYKKGICKESEKLYNEMITIPLHTNMNEDDVMDVIKSLDKVLDYYYK